MVASSPDEQISQPTVQSLDNLGVSWRSSRKDFWRMTLLFASPRFDFRMLLALERRRLYSRERDLYEVQASSSAHAFHTALANEVQSVPGASGGYPR